MSPAEVEPLVRTMPSACCAGGWWLRAEAPPLSDEDAQPETD